MMQDLRKVVHLRACWKNVRPYSELVVQVHRLSLFLRNVRKLMLLEIMIISQMMRMPKMTKATQRLKVVSVLNPINDL